MANFREILFISTLCFWCHVALVSALDSDPSSQNTQPSSGSQSESVPSSNPWPSSPASTTSASRLSSTSNAPSSSSGQSTTVSTSSPTAITSAGGPTACNTDTTLENFCGDFLRSPNEDNAKLLSFFGLATSVKDILDMVIDTKTISALSSCPDGVWCLDDSHHETIYQGMVRFFQTPICNRALWVCLESMREVRNSCPNNGDLLGLMEMLSLLCDLHDLGDLQPECYTRTVEILHVLHSDALRGARVDLDGPVCADYLTKIVKTFLCTIDPCGVKQTVFLKEFDPLADISLNSEMVFVKCNLGIVCPDNTTLAPRVDMAVDGKTEAGPSLPTRANDTVVEEEIKQEEMAEETQLDKVFDKLEEKLAQQDMQKTNGETNLPTIDTNVPSSDTNVPSSDTNVPSSDSGTIGGDSWTGDVSGGTFDDDANGMNVSGFDLNGDQTMLFGTITLSTLVLFGLIAIGYMTFRHYRVRRGTSYKRGYSQLSDEESRMLNNYE